MSVVAASPSTGLPGPAGPRPRRWTREEYYRLAELGLFRGQRVMLIDGEILLMSHAAAPHAAATTLTEDALRGAFGAGFTVRVQQPLELGRSSDPEPDLAVVGGGPRDYAAAHPTSALLIVEVADTSLAFDRTDKASLYAAAGILDYWIVNLIDRQLEIRRSPRPDHAQPFGAGYVILTVHSPSDVVAPLSVPQAQIPVADLLP
jgi:Uma2 family endonuclease